MRKKQLLLQIEQLIVKNTELYKDNVALSNNIVKKDATIKDLNNEILVLKNKLDNIAENEEKCVVSDNKLPLSEELSTNLDMPNTTTCETSSNEENIIYESGFNEVDYSNTDSKLIDENDDFSNASEAIGKAVLKCAQLCNNFAMNDSLNAKDLINLALGRTEVFKSEVLQIVNCTDDVNEQIELIGERFNDLIEYFNLLEKQI